MLSSAYAQRFALSEEQNRGTVIWHTLSENAEIQTYDMKFGETIIANIPASEVVPALYEGHGKEKEDDEVNESVKKVSKKKPHGPRLENHASRPIAIKNARN